MICKPSNGGCKSLKSILWKIRRKESLINIGINITSAVAGGGVVYLDNLIKHISGYGGTNKYYIYDTIKPTIKRSENESGNFEWLIFKFPSLGSIFRIFWEQFILPVYLKRDKIQILFCPANIGLLFYKIPFVVVVQSVAMFDDNLIRREKLLPKFRFLFLRLLTIHSMRKARKVIFISKAAQKTLCEKYNIRYEKTTVIYHGNENCFNLDFNQIDIHKVTKLYGLDKYILFVSNIYQFKNFYELILAFISIKDRIDKRIKLVFAGVSFDDVYYKRLKKIIFENNCEDHIQFLGHVSNEVLPFLYTSSLLYVYPSTLESFGMTLVEAMCCGSPIIASNIEPIPEICHEAALYFNPNDSDDIAEKMLMLLQSGKLQADLSKKALKRAKFFSWEKTTLETLNLIESAHEDCNQ